MHKPTTTVFTAGLILFSQAVFALGLGDARVHSYLGQPLDIDIRLLSESEAELNTVTAGLAAAMDYEFVGMNQNLSVPVTFSVSADPANPLVNIRSRLPVQEPVVQLVVEVSWSGGRMLKEYTLFLDPPTIAASAPPPLVINQSAQTNRQRPEPPAVRYPDPDSIDSVETRRRPAAAQSTPDMQRDRRGDQPAVTRAPAIDTPMPEEAAAAPVPEMPEMPEPVIAREPETTRSTEVVTATVPADHLVDSPGDTDSAADAAQTPTDPGHPPDSADAPGAGEPEPRVDLDSAAPPEPGSALDEQPEEPVDEALPAQEPPPSGMEGTESVAEAQADGIPAAGAESPDVTDPAADSPASADRPDPDLSAPVSEPEIQFETGGEAYGPVQAGETLWGIAVEYTQGTRYSINQAMLAIQRMNPDAFGGNNINSLRRGAILRMPTFNEISRLDRRQAMLEAMRQEQEHRNRRLGLPAQEDLPQLAQAGTDPLPEPAAADTPEQAFTDPDDARLELVPPSNGDSGGGAYGGDADATGAVASEELRETLARTEEELANAQQENEYLAERVRELEAQIEARAGDVQDSGLAEMESRLRDERLQGGQESESPVIPAQKGAWYEGKTGWLMGGLVALVLFVTWLLRRMGGGGAGPGGLSAEERETVLKMRNEAEELLDSLDSDQTVQYQPGDLQADSGAAQEPAAEEEAATGPVDDESQPAELKDPDVNAETRNVIELERYATAGDEEGRRPPRSDGEEAEVIELDSDDPELRLDLARAYISMGDTETARSMLESVLAEGDDEQKAEASQMMAELDS